MRLLVYAVFSWEQEWKAWEQGHRRGEPQQHGPRANPGRGRQQRGAHGKCRHQCYGTPDIARRPCYLPLHHEAGSLPAGSPNRKAAAVDLLRERRTGSPKLA